MLETEKDSVKVQNLNPGEEAVIVDSSYHSLKISMTDHEIKMPSLMKKCFILSVSKWLLQVYFAKDKHISVKTMHFSKLKPICTPEDLHRDNFACTIINYKIKQHSVKPKLFHFDLNLSMSRQVYSAENRLFSSAEELISCY